MGDRGVCSVSAATAILLEHSACDSDALLRPRASAARARASFEIRGTAAVCRDDRLGVSM